jgi:hypothetical protein
MTRCLSDLYPGSSKVGHMIDFDVVVIYLSLGGFLLGLVFIAQACSESDRIQVKCTKA